MSPDAIHEHVKTKQLEHKAKLHYTAPEYAGTHAHTIVTIHVHVHVHVYIFCLQNVVNLQRLQNAPKAHKFLNSDPLSGQGCSQRKIIEWDTKLFYPWTSIIA